MQHLSFPVRYCAHVIFRTQHYRSCHYQSLSLSRPESPSHCSMPESFSLHYQPRNSPKECFEQCLPCCTRASVKTQVPVFFSAQTKAIHRYRAFRLVEYLLRRYLPPEQFAGKLRHMNLSKLEDA